MDRPNQIIKGYSTFGALAKFWFWLCDNIWFERQVAWRLDPIRVECWPGSKALAVRQSQVESGSERGRTAHTYSARVRECVCECLMTFRRIAGIEKLPKTEINSSGGRWAMGQGAEGAEREGEPSGTRKCHLLLARATWSGKPSANNYARTNPMIDCIHVLITENLWS